MPSARSSITIARPVSDVFAYVADMSNARAWRPAVLDVELASGDGLGAVYHQEVKGPGGRRIAADLTLTAFEPNRRLAFQTVAGPVRPSGEYRFSEAPGGTEVTFSLEVTLTGWKKWLMSRAVQSTMEAEVANLARLKQVLES